MTKSGLPNSSLEQWKLMLSGRPSQVIRNMLVLSLTVLSLVVWVATVFGVGIFRGAGGGLGPQTASASTVVVPAQPFDELLRRIQDDPASVSGTPVAAVGMPIRDPFEASAMHFGQVVTKQEAERESAVVSAADAAEARRAAGLLQVAPRSGGGSSQEEKGAAVLTAPLKLDGVMASSGSSVAVINGQIFRVGDTIKVRVGEQVLEVSVLTISAKSVELGAGEIGRAHV